MQRGKPTEAITLADQRELQNRIVLTPAIHEHIIGNVRKGMFETQACKLAGVNPIIYHRWKKWGEEGEEPYATFLRELMAAKQSMLEEALDIIRAGDKEWKRAAWWLERMYPEWREDNETDAPLPDPPVETIIREVKARLTPHEIAQVIRSLSGSDQVMGLLTPGGSHDVQNAAHQSEPEEAADPGEPGEAGD